MPHHTAILDTALPVEDAFTYLADFSNTQAWDPSVVSATKTTAGAPAVGTTFDLTVRILGRPKRLRYTITDLDRPRLVQLESRSRLVHSIDRISFTRTSSGTQIAYDADVRTRAGARLAAPLLAVVFRRMAERAEQGLARDLARLASHTRLSTSPRSLD